MLVDDRRVVVGSIDLDFLSMEDLEEGSLVVDDRTFAADFEERWRVEGRQPGLGGGARQPAVALDDALSAHFEPAESLAGRFLPGLASAHRHRSHHLCAVAHARDTGVT